MTGLPPSESMEGFRITLKSPPKMTLFEYRQKFPEYLKDYLSIRLFSLRISAVNVVARTQNHQFLLQLLIYVLSYPILCLKYLKTLYQKNQWHHYKSWFFHNRE